MSYSQVIAVAVVLGAGSAAAKSPIEIPLKEVWALNMPGTQDVNKLDVRLDRPNLSNQELRKRSLVVGISWATRDRKAGQSPGPGFVVSGNGAEALRNAHAVITNAEKKKKPDQIAPPDTELSIVFYAHTSGRYHWITQIERNGNDFVVTYQSTPHTTADVTNHFALIPVGKVDPQGYRTKFGSKSSVTHSPLK
jgi:hypothetical protein